MQVNGFMLFGEQMTKQIPLTQGKFALVDDDMFEYLNQWKWGIIGKGYVARKTSRRLGKPRKTVYIHRVIMNTPDDLDTDHRDGNKLNNQRNNLRVCQTIQNAANSQRRHDNTSGYKGVRKNGNRWRAELEIKGAIVFSKTFSTSKEAARAYDEAAKKYFGEFARLNFPE